jgi:SAM-dependent methyltransferase
MQMTKAIAIGADLTDARHIYPAADVAGAAVLLNIGERIGILPYLTDGAAVTSGLLAAAVGLPQDALGEYLRALVSAGLLDRLHGDEETFSPSALFTPMLHAVGYVSWTLNANRPFVEHAAEFFQSPTEARKTVQRDGHQIAVTSQWMGAEDFYPAARDAILALRPTRFVDLGAGSARLLIEILLACPDATGVALDISAKACDAARAAAARAGVIDRLEVTERSIESVANAPEILDGADAIHGGFVFHDMLPHDETTFDRVLANCAQALQRTRGKMLVTDAAPYASAKHERMFSAAVTFLHLFFMGRRLLSDEEWSDKFTSQGFKNVQTMSLPFPTGRLYTASVT